MIKLCVLSSPVLTLSAPFIRVEHQPTLGLLQLHLQPLMFALQLSDLLLPLLQHPQPGVKVEQTLRTKQTQTLSQIHHRPAGRSQQSLRDVTANSAGCRAVYTGEGGEEGGGRRWGLAQVERGAANLL